MKDLSWVSHPLPYSQRTTECLWTGGTFRLFVVFTAVLGWQIHSSYGQVWTSILYISHFLTQLIITVTSLFSLPCMSIKCPPNLSHVIHCVESSCIVGARWIITFSRSCDTRTWLSPTYKIVPKLGIVQYFFLNEKKKKSCSFKQNLWIFVECGLKWN